MIKVNEKKRYSRKGAEFAELREEKRRKIFSCEGQISDILIKIFSKIKKRNCSQS